MSRRLHAAPHSDKNVQRPFGITTDYADYYYFLQPVGRKAKELGERLFMILLQRLMGQEERVLLAVDDSPTKRYGPKVEGAGIHHNPTPGPADQKYLYGHIWITLHFLKSSLCVEETAINEKWLFHHAAVAKDAAQQESQGWFAINRRRIGRSG